MYSPYKYFSYKNRQKKIMLFSKIFNDNISEKILDVGFTNSEFTGNENYFEQYYYNKARITALGIEDGNNFKKSYPQINVVKYDGFNFPFKDNSFDIVFSNAVLEHVGNFKRQEEYLSEIIRVGKRGFITTPNAKFFLETHTKTFFLHYFPKNYFDIYLSLIRKSWATGDYMNLLDFKSINKLFKKFNNINYVIYRNKFLKIFTVDFVIVFFKFDK